MLYYITRINYCFLRLSDHYELSSLLYCIYSHINIKKSIWKWLGKILCLFCIIQHQSQNNKHRKTKENY